jgi:hypothetical protein
MTAAINHREFARQLGFKTLMDIVVSGMTEDWHTLNVHRVMGAIALECPMDNSPRPATEPKS